MPTPLQQLSYQQRETEETRGFDSSVRQTNEIALCYACRLFSFRFVAVMTGRRKKNGYRKKTSSHVTDKSVCFVSLSGQIEEKSLGHSVNEMTFPRIMKFTSRKSESIFRYINGKTDLIRRWKITWVDHEHEDVCARVYIATTNRSMRSWRLREKKRMVKHGDLPLSVVAELIMFN